MNDYRDSYMNEIYSNFNKFENGHKYMIKFLWENNHYICRGYDSGCTTDNISDAKILTNKNKIKEVTYQFDKHLFSRLRNYVNYKNPRYELVEV